MPNLRKLISEGDQPGCSSATMDPSIKLFGQTIGVSSTHTDAGADAGVLKPTSAGPWDATPSYSQDGGGSIVLQAGEDGVVEKRFCARNDCREDYLQPPKSSEMVTESGALTAGAFCEENDGSRSDDQKDLGESGQTFQKPDKVVACPRCDSLDTKFCYYNNYNVNQPRHFCKNCQRYWTAGGTLRNVPVGAGRRKNKHGGSQRDGLDCPIASTMQSDSADSTQQLLSCSLGSPTSQKVTPLKIPQPKRLLLPGGGSPLRSPGSTSSFGQDSGLSMASPYSLHQNGRLPFQSYSCSKGYMTPGTDASIVGSSDTASTQGLRQAQYPPSGYDNEGSRSSLGGKQDMKSLSPLQISLNPSMSQLDPSNYQTLPVNDGGSWAGNGGPFGFFNGEWPYGYHVEYHQGPQPHGATFSTPVLKSCAGHAPLSNPSWTPAQWGPWATPTMAAQLASTGWPGGQTMGQGLATQSPVLHSALGKRPAPEVGRVEGGVWAAKTQRTIDRKESPRSMWPMLGKVHPEASNNGGMSKLFQPKLENSVLYEQRDSIAMNRHFAPTQTARSVPFQVTI